MNISNVCPSPKVSVKNQNTIPLKFTLGNFKPLSLFSFFTNVTTMFKEAEVMNLGRERDREGKKGE